MGKEYKREEDGGEKTWSSEGTGSSSVKKGGSFGMGIKGKLGAKDRI